MVYTVRFFSSKRSLFHNSILLGSCIIHILYTGCAKIKKNNPGAKRLMKVKTTSRNSALSLCSYVLLRTNYVPCLIFRASHYVTPCRISHFWLSVPLSDKSHFVQWSCSFFFLHKMNVNFKISLSVRWNVGLHFSCCIFVKIYDWNHKVVTANSSGRRPFLLCVVDSTL